MNGRTDTTAPCPRWCEYADARNHPDNHVAHVGEVTTTVFPTNRVVVVTVEAGLAESMPLPVLAVGYSTREGGAVTVRLTWTELERLAAMLLDGKRRYQ